ncbi:YcxB family protein [Psychromonas sp. PT13]|uniref:YcxB family protein n=1 Tax=Psychromonas sp. PT13 TaxID=3439547 RepID=UPI003EBCE8E3
MHFESEFILDRQHLEECYDQSQPFSKNQTPRIKLISLLIIAGITLLIFTDQQNHLAFFLIALATVEYLSFYYRKGWWVTRQFWSKNAGNTISLTIDDKGITTKSLYINSELKWDDISHIDETEKGLLLTLKRNGSNYLSKANLNDNVVTFIQQQITSNQNK